MSSVQNDPAELRRFMAAMRQFNSEVKTNTDRLRSQLYSLQNTWRDGKYAEFSTQLETLLQRYQRYLNTAEIYHTHLDSKAAALEEYQSR